ncbi:hypothetical protein SERLADRAFT_414930 [Serpula lacrymans var. lacrymans S7.9]|uniref:ubiquitinyl hydrolase 1 n=1 Tax=Serpula lacrymans var. lacrymans (strain S7.9) TaxID=578457 RepID=F8NUW9_SERL9|nr:uncharacterized protein SERLADRAFT_414930 [Serpula lacrymans var. lacrymans S7.9]EGO25284.1 hypothetical protein SERLADRAFT_414930 [Serpula lacrymans var. lacrymans S7.9]
MVELERLKDMIYHEKQQAGSMLCAQHALNSLMHTLEGHYDHDASVTSMNMDDTGFFSVQVLEHALNIWGLSTQLAFILNQNQHWYTIRRFGTANPDPTVDSGNGHWFNLNSFESSPQWVGRLYLDVFLQQAESDGYSVFVVTQVDPSAPLALPRTDADEVASTVPEPSSASSINLPLSSTSADTSAATSLSHLKGIEGFEDEDMELQAALQASLMGGSTHGLSFSHLSPPPLSTGVRSAGSSIPAGQDPFGNADVDPVTASMERNRVIMERMRREQEIALREQYEGEIARMERTRHPSVHENTDEHLMRATAESRRTQELTQPHAQGDSGMEHDDEDEDYQPPHSTYSRQNTELSHTVYDDDDAELQAALRASLEDVPPGFSIPTTPPLHRTAVPVSEATAPNALDAETVDETRSEAETSTAASESVTEESISLDEIRRRRLARFGG